MKNCHFEGLKIINNESEILLIENEGEVINSTNCQVLKNVISDIENANFPEQIAAQHFAVLKNSVFCDFVAEISEDIVIVVDSFAQYKKRLKNAPETIEKKLQKEIEQLRRKKTVATAIQLKEIDRKISSIEFAGKKEIEQMKIGISRTLKAIELHPIFWNVKIENYKKQLVMFELKKYISQ